MNAPQKRLSPFYSCGSRAGLSQVRQIPGNRQASAGRGLARDFVMELTESEQRRLRAMQRNDFSAAMPLCLSDILGNPKKNKIGRRSFWEASDIGARLAVISGGDLR